jgi:hypothetical protein
MENKYYLLSYSTDLSIIGRFPQSETGFLYNTHNLIRYRQPIDFDIKTGVQLVYHAKRTDLLCSSPYSGCGRFIISKKMLEVLLKHNIGDKFQYFPAEIRHRKKVYDDYYFFYSYDERDDFFLYEESMFAYVMWDKSDRKPLTNIRKAEDLIELRLRAPSGYLFVVEHLAINPEIYKNNEDMVLCPSISVHFFISQRLRLALEYANCTGIAFKEVEGQI